MTRYGWLEGHEEMTIRTQWATVPKISQYRFSYLELNRKFLDLSTLGSLDGEGFVDPVEVIDRKAPDLYAA
jgi:hypothetical protein